MQTEPEESRMEIDENGDVDEENHMIGCYINLHKFLDYASSYTQSK